MPVPLLIGMAFAMGDVYKWQGVSTETMVSLGSAFLPAAVLVFLQRRFVTQVSVAASQATTTPWAPGSTSGFARLTPGSTRDIWRWSSPALQPYGNVGRSVSISRRIAWVTHRP